jgi:tetratricopeptide (TPR) repeat protein
MPDLTDDELFQSAQAHFNGQRNADAQAQINELLARKPDHVEGLNLRGLCFFRMGRTADAEQALRAALRVRPDYATALNNLGVMLAGTRRHAEAAEIFARAAEAKPNDATALLNLANSYAAQEKYDLAIPAYRRCLTVNPAVLDALQNLGQALRATGKAEEAVAYYNQAASLQSENPDAADRFATALRDVGRYKEADEAFGRALALKKDHASALWNRSLLRLLQGNFEEGWKDYEQRLRMPDAFVLKLRRHHGLLGRPAWDGSSPAGKRFFIYAEQGFGDTIQFARYLPMLAREGAKITCACHTALVPLLKNVEGVEHCQPFEQPPPEFDEHFPLMSLPRRFQTTVETIPAQVPYIHPDPQKVSQWRSRMSGDTRRKIGLAWVGRRKPDPRRSMAMSDLSSLSSVENVHWISLQKGEGAAEIRNAPAGLAITDWTGELNDFSDTAALIANLDCVVTIDTAAAHLAGAMGKKVFLMLPKFATWRWMLDRNDSPWYPTMRLFRQSAQNDWQPAVAQVIQAL